MASYDLGAMGDEAPEDWRCSDDGCCSLLHSIDSRSSGVGVKINGAVSGAGGVLGSVWDAGNEEGGKSDVWKLLLLSISTVRTLLASLHL